MSLEAWGDEEPEGCAVYMCAGLAAEGQETCAEHSDLRECGHCGEWLSEDQLNEGQDHELV